MLARIEEVQGIGLLHQANGKPYTCKKATLIYAENGRGKSTLATIFRSVSTGNVSAINDWKTVDSTLPPKVIVQVESGKKITFENGTWSEQRPEFMVFDSDFIGRNVHSGGSVSTDHRKCLLAFALGDGAVAARKVEEQATEDAKASTEKVKDITKQLLPYHTGLTLTQFEQLQPIQDLTLKLAELQKRLAAASSIATIKAKLIPKAINEPMFDIDDFFDGLALSLNDVHEGAEKQVKDHISKLKGIGAEKWLSLGLQFSSGSTCPYCDQDISNNELIHAYQTHFNTVYTDLKKRVSSLQDTVMASSEAGIIDRFSKDVEVSAAQASAWAEHAPTPGISFDATTTKKNLEAFRGFVLALARKKEATPTESIGSIEDKATASELWEKVLAPIRISNSAIKTTEAIITKYKAQLSSDNIPQLQQQIRQLEATKHRFDPTVTSLMTKLGTARLNEKAAEKAKEAARKNLDSLMETTLGKYQKSINTLLTNFGASFSIKGMKANYKGSAPRTEYGLLLRGKDVALEGGSPPFATALSEGDKRTLAFAFFIASALDDPNLKDRIVIIDDPMCSLDINRKETTRTVLKKIHARSAQLITLAHDPYFLRDLRDALIKEDKAAPVAIFQLVIAPGDYTDFASLDIDKECESAYSKHHRLLNTFASGNGGDTMSIAKAIRPMLEGYLHRRFPGLLPKDLMFGQVVSVIRNSHPPSPLCHAANLVDELSEINDYAGKFHHDANPGKADSVVIVASELRIFVNRALNLVHKSVP